MRHRPVFAFIRGAVVVWSFVAGLTSGGLAQVPTVPAQFRVNTLDTRNYTRQPPIPETFRLADFLALNCSQIPEVVAKDQELKRACLLGDSLRRYTTARTALQNDLVSAPEELSFGYLRLRNPESPWPDLRDKIRRFLIAKQYVELCFQSATNIVRRWWMPTSDNFFRYVAPQSEAAMAGGLDLPGIISFDRTLVCHGLECKQARAELRNSLARILNTFSNYHLGPSSQAGIPNLKLGPRRAYERALYMKDVQTRFETLANNPDDLISLLQDGRGQNDTISSLNSALDAWLDELFRIPFFGQPATELDLAQILGKQAMAQEYLSELGFMDRPVGADALPKFVLELAEQGTRASKWLSESEIDLEARIRSTLKR